jgi:hypothetical protein
MSTKLNEIRKSYLTKTASPKEKEVIKLNKEAIGKLPATLAAGLISGPAAAIGYQSLKNAYFRRQAEDRFPLILKKYPVLKEYDQGTVHEQFNVLKDMAPMFARMPLLAGPWLVRAMQYSEEGITPSQLQDVMDIESRRREFTSVEPRQVGKIIEEISPDRKALMAAKR